MCGIFGIFSRDNNLPDAQIVERSCQLMSHRGPDDQGIYRDSTTTLGHRRLSIIDINSGHQPIHNEDSSIWTVFNGEIYNFIELRDELISYGHVFYTQTDTEVIVHAWEQWGKECFKRFRGMFAIAIWDIKSRQLILARDPLGKKPLYYTLQNNSLIFSSELKSIKSLPNINFTVNYNACRDYALMGYIPTPRSIYNEVSKLKPGHSLIINNDSITEQQFYILDFLPKHHKSESELLEELDHTLNEAVRLRLRSDVDFGAFLSGGIDSAVVTTLMARNLTLPVKTYSIGFEEEEFNELSDARRIANHIGSDHHEFIVKADAISLLDKLVWHFDEPFADSSSIPTYLVSQMASKHVKMVLSGDGGDEAFGGYERYLKYRTIEKIYKRSSGLAGPLINTANKLWPFDFNKRLLWLGKRLSLPFPDRYISGVSLCTPDFCDSWLDIKSGDTGYGAVSTHFNHGYTNNYDEMIHGDINTYLLDDIMVKVDRMTMANSLEVRSPLLDQELMQWAVKLPVNLKLGKSTGKYLLKKYAETILPKEALAKKKQGFAIPLDHWFRNDLYELARDIINSNSFKQRGIFNHLVANRLLTEHSKGKQQNGEHLWQMISFELWAREFLD